MQPVSLGTFTRHRNLQTQKEAKEVYLLICTRQKLIIFQSLQLTMLMFGK
jgi:hypothetical protein